MRSLAPLALVFGLASIAAPAEAGTVKDFLASPVKAIFQKVAAKKHDRVFHAAGKAYWATVANKDGTSRPAIVRVSRGGAAKPGKPDILGIAVKIPGEGGGKDQDFLMVTAKSNEGIGARIPKFQNSFGGQSFSSLLSFRGEGLKGPITTQLPRGFVTPLDLTGTAKPAGDQSFKISIQQGGVLRKKQSRVLEEDVTVHFDKPVGSAKARTLKFTPWHDGGGIEPVGVINRLRKAAYVGSETGRGVQP